jgi:ketosteroid isomerase-like protein
MSQERSQDSTAGDLVERERQGWEAFNRGELGVNFRPDVVLQLAGYGMGTFNGMEAANGFAKDWRAAFEDLTVEIEEVLDLGNGVLLSLYHQEGRPIGSDNYLRVRSASVSVWEDGGVARMTIYPEADIDAARVAAARLAQDRAEAPPSRGYR